MDTSGSWSEDVVRVLESLSEPLPPEARELFQEDPESLRIYLASDAFWESFLSERSTLQLAPETFFRILIERFRQKLKYDPSFREQYRSYLRDLSQETWDSKRTRTLLEDEALVKYLVRMLKRFVRTEDVYQLPIEDDEEEYRYIFEMIQASLEGDEHQAFQIFCHIGNYTLYLTGVFPDWVEHRNQYKNRPMDLNSYRTYGKTYFERAANHSLANRWKLRSVLTKLSRGYDPVRAMLNFMFQKLLPAS